jgi:hypothetical protein
VSKHRGRIIKIMGDGVLVEFASAVEGDLPTLCSEKFLGLVWSCQPDVWLEASGCPRRRLRIRYRLTGGYLLPPRDMTRSTPTHSLSHCDLKIKACREMGEPPFPLSLMEAQCKRATPLRAPPFRKYSDSVIHVDSAKVCGTAVLDTVTRQGGELWTSWKRGLRRSA